MNLIDLIGTAVIVLMGEEGKDFSYYENDPDQWAIILHINRN